MHRPPLLQAVIGVFELPEDDSQQDDEHFIEIEETPGTIESKAQLRMLKSASGARRKYCKNCSNIDKLLYSNMVENIQEYFLLAESRCL